MDALIENAGKLLASEQAENIDKAFETLRKLDIAHIPKSLYSDLSEHPLKCFQYHMIEPLKHLKELDLQGSKLNEVPKAIAQLTKLQFLYLHDNNINEVPSSIGFLSDLIWLDLERNNLKVLPAEIGRLKNLHRLNLSFNQLNVLPVEIGQLSQLQSLYLDGNRFSAPERQRIQQSLPKTEIYF
ncbi:leucine-rich repeat domain-containing protein [Microscilla marina]|uniref:Leucine-rich repeat containing protein n=1 Tax=Microscilla marina ATCC 23134 TaxID=313606 RepID=A1ZZ22_MICM2|nr:leucine-rich repeat domain-containing protein [Microscilla marina]EAY24344.1 leucine-rich repeat containing protein [Microscilla marina ATCC 23134]